MTNADRNVVDGYVLAVTVSFKRHTTKSASRRAVSIASVSYNEEPTTVLRRFVQLVDVPALVSVVMSSMPRLGDAFDSWGLVASVTKCRTR